jgi:hypothetical protein
MIKSKLAKSAPRTLHLILTKRQEKKKKSTEAQKSSGCVDLLRRGDLIRRNLTWFTLEMATLPHLLQCWSNVKELDLATVNKNGEP